ncbi:primase-helicase family protein [Vibrio breoganii]
MTKTALKIDEPYRFEKALADAICHEMVISFADTERIDIALIRNESHKRIIETFKELYEIPTTQPNNKQIADDIHCSMVRVGYSGTDADKEANAIENLIGRKRAPNVTLVADAIKYFTTDTTKQTFLHLISNDDSPLAYDALVDLCRKANNEELEEHREQIVNTFNASHSVVKHGSKTLICEKSTDHKNNVSYEFTPEHQKRAFYANLNFTYLQEKKIKKANCFSLWMTDIDRKTYHGVVFDPSNNASDRYLNMWAGFAVDGRDGDDKLNRIMWHLLHIICNSNEEHYKYLLAWMAHIIQRPEQKSGVCVVLKSEARGTGKSTVSILLERLLGQHAIRVQDAKHFLGAFNSHLANKLFVTIEEAFWSGSDKDAGKLRTLITESTITIEAKGKDAIQVDSYHRFMMCTNNDWAVPQTRDERRFFVLEVSEDKKQDSHYFSDLHQDINSNEAMGQLFSFLKGYDIEEYNLAKAPITEAIQQQIMESLPSEAAWLNSVLENGSLADSNNSYDLEIVQTIPKKSFFDDYIAYCDKMNIQGYHRCKPNALGSYLCKVIKLSDGGKRSIYGERLNCYRTKPLAEMVALFNDYYEYK